MKHLKCKTIFFLVILFLPLAVFADTAVDQLTQMLTGLRSLQANFAQAVYDGNGRVLQQTRGTMALQRPGKFRWETQSPSKQLLIADSTRVWFYDADLQQVTVQKQQNNNKNSPAMLLNGTPQELAQNFTVAYVNSTQQNMQTFKLTPKLKSSLFAAVELSFQNQQLHSMRLIDSLGQTTVINFSQVKNNPVLQPALFHFVPPRGVDVVRE